jgi:hypothetical protein
MTQPKIWKALSVRQPWAWMILHGKDIENRTWPIDFRGDFMLHTGLECTRSEYRDACNFARSIAPELRIPALEDLERGGIVGVGTITGCLPPREIASRKWHMSGQYGAVLEQMRTTRFVPCKGLLNFFEVPAEIAARVLSTEVDVREPKPVVLPPQCDLFGG